MNFPQKAVDLILESEGIEESCDWLGGLYEIRNTVNGKIYIGSTNNLLRREKEHFKELRKGEHHSITLQRAFDKYGEESFVFTEICRCPDDRLIELEQSLLDSTKAAETGYNISPFANSGFRGRTWSESHKAWLSELRTGQYDGENNPFFGQKHTPETRARMRLNQVNRTGEANGFFGKSHSVEAREKMSRSRVGVTAGSKNVMFGRKHSEESKRKMSETKKKNYANRIANTTEGN